MTFSATCRLKPIFMNLLLITGIYKKKGKATYVKFLRKLIALKFVKIQTDMTV